MREESQTQCLGRDEEGFEEFHSDGTLVVGTRDGEVSDMKANWRLQGNTLERTYVAPFANTSTVRDRIRFEGNRMILWNTEMKQGFIYGRHGAEVNDQATPVTDGTAIETQLNGARFRFAPPADYREIRRTQAQVGWGPVRGDGLEFGVSFGEACSGEGDSVVREEVDRQLLSYTVFRCIHARDSRCDVERSDEQPLSEADVQQGLKVCRTLELSSSRPTREETVSVKVGWLSLELPKEDPGASAAASHFCPEASIKRPLGHDAVLCQLSQDVRCSDVEAMAQADREMTGNIPEERRLGAVTWYRSWIGSGYGYSRCRDDLYVSFALMFANPSTPPDARHPAVVRAEKFLSTARIITPQPPEVP